MFAAEMTQNCGINSWMRNSQIVHAVSQSAFGLYSRTDVVLPPFEHEPDMARSRA